MPCGQSLRAQFAEQQDYDGQDDGFNREREVHQLRIEHEPRDDRGGHGRCSNAGEVVPQKERCQQLVGRLEPHGQLLGGFAALGSEVPDLVLIACEDGRLGKREECGQHEKQK